MTQRRSATRLVHVTARELAPYAQGLRALEASITYPAGERAFQIDHGADYHPFFSGMGEAHFVVARDREAVVGNVAGVLKSVRFGGRAIQALYIGDLKVAASQRGLGLSSNMLRFGLWRLFVTPSLRGVRLLYGAAMRGGRGDVTRTARGVSPMKLASPWATCALYFVDPGALASLDASRCPSPPTTVGLDLSPAARSEAPGFVSTAGEKDLRLAPDGRAWPLVHLPLGPAAWSPSFGAYLRACGEALMARSTQGPACFALDQRLIEHCGWLSTQGLVPTAEFAVYGVDLTRVARRAAWVHLATSEI